MIFTVIKNPKTQTLNDCIIKEKSGEHTREIIMYVKVASNIMLASLSN